ncbi:DUF5908 family protein [Sphingomonas soli]|uniref:DUF5908 family protein n=1 Tax=Sphingomonas soli TaxID=266127 RepID=UPI000832C0EA|nr:DUF5908 family protein [Sphingomonas soli]
MTLHISEIGVRMAISEGSGPGAGGEGGPAASPGQPAITAAQREALVEECVRNVLATLRLAERR